MVVLLNDNASPTLRPRIATCTQALLGHFIWETFDRPLYNLNLAPNDYRLFSKMKICLATQRFETNEELMNEVNNWLDTLAVPFFDERLQRRVSRYEKCFNLGGYYTEN